MARPFSSSDAKRALSEHERLKAKLSEIHASVDAFSGEVLAACDKITAKAANKLLADIPVEEINRDKKGIRVKALRDRGYNTVADVNAAAAFSLVSVNGISKEGAAEIKKIAAQMADEAKKDVKLRLSVDDKTPETTKLVTALCRYKGALPVVSNCEALEDEYASRLAFAAEDLSAAAGTFKWMFASDEKKQKATAAFSVLNEAVTGDYARTVTGSAEELRKLKFITDRAAWQQFSEDPVGFYNALEQLAPDLLGNDDAVYGLPEDLAAGVAEQDFFPDGLLCTLRRYQEWGVKYVLHQGRVLLGDEMGLGKTVQAIAAMVSLKNTGATHFLVVCPASVLSNWCREVAKMSRLNVIRVHGAYRDMAFEFWKNTGGVAVTTYETTGALEFADDFRFSMLVVDEAHYIKNPAAQRTANVKEIGAHAERMLFMTGTALENKVDEMIALIEILQPEVAQSVKSVAFMSSAPQFRTRVAPVYYRRKREDVLTELPELIESKEWCTLGAAEEAVYERWVLAKNYAQARRVSWNADTLEDSSKAQRLAEIVDEAAQSGRKVLVFSFFLDTVARVTELLGSRCMQPITGAVPPARRQEIIDEYEKAPDGAVLVAQIQSGGTGLNIQSASVVVICEPQFKPSIENQAVSRAYRMGQTRSVLVYRLLCDDTVDEKITDLLESKQAVFDAFADDSAAAEETLSIDDAGFGNIINEEIERINAKNGKEENNEA